MYEFFNLDELKCKCGSCYSKGYEMRAEFMQKLEALRKACGFPFVLSSAYRCPAHNQAVSTTGEKGPHTTGRAVDVAVKGTQAFKILSIAASFGFTGIGGAKTFIHLDDLQAPDYPRPNFWVY